MSVRTIVEHGCPLTVQTLERVDALGGSLVEVLDNLDRIRERLDRALGSDSGG